MRSRTLRRGLANRFGRMAQQCHQNGARLRNAQSTQVLGRFDNDFQRGIIQGLLQQANDLC